MNPETIVKLDNANIFQQKNLVLSNVSLQIDRGEFVYLIGKTGSGKSSLLKILYGDAILTEGDGDVGGFQLHNLRTRQVPYLRRKLGIVFQDFQLLTDRSVNANLYFVLKATGWKDKAKMQQRVDN